MMRGRSLTWELMALRMEADAAAAADAAARPLHDFIAADQHAARVARLAASLPPAEVSSHLRAQADAHRLMSVASQVLFAQPASAPAAVVQAAADLLQAIRLGEVAGIGAFFTVGAGVGRRVG
jgi:hypothetical protein